MVLMSWLESVTLPKVGRLDMVDQGCPGLREAVLEPPIKQGLLQVQLEDEPHILQKLGKLSLSE
jgi:hypothetical protein